MGRFYRTASANPLDYMYKLNTPLMEKVLTTNDQYIDQNVQLADQLSQAASYNHLAGDEEDAKTITDGYNQKINDITEAIRTDPANWRKQLDPIRTVKQDLVTNYQTGAISKQVGNYNARKTAYDKVDEQVKLYHTSGGKKGVSPERAAAYKQDWDKSFTKTGYDAKTNAFNIYKGGEIMDNIDVKKVLSEGLDKIKADKSNQYEERPDGTQWYLNKVTNKKEQITPEKVLSIATDNINPQLMDYLRQDSKVGLVKGVYDDDGNFIKPYDFETVGLSEQESAHIDEIKKSISKVKDPKAKAEMEKTLNDQINAANNRTRLSWNNNSYFTPILRGLANQYSYTSVEQGNDLSNNAKGAAIFSQGQQNYRQGRQLAQADRHFKTTQGNIESRFKETFGLAKDRFEFDKYKFEHPQTKPTSTTSKTAGAKDAPPPVETALSKLSVNSLATLKTYDRLTNQEVPLLSVAGLTSDIVKFKDETKSLSTELKQIDEVLKHEPSNQVEAQAQAKLQDRREQINIKLAQKNSDLNDRRAWYGMATEAALSNHPKTGITLSAAEIETYKRAGGKTVEDMRKEVAEIEKKYPKVRENHPLANGSYGAGTIANNMLVDAPQVREARAKLADFIKIKGKVDKAKNGVLDQLKKTYINSDAIVPNAKESQEVADILLNDTQGLALFTEDGHKATSFGEIDGAGVSFFNTDNYNLSFEGKNNLKDYMARYGASMKVDRIGATTKLDNNGNAVVKVSFVDPKGILPKTPFYVGLTPQLQKSVTSKFASNKNPEIAKVAKSIGNEEANYVRSQLISPATNEVFDKDNPKRTIFVTSIKGNKVPLEVTELEDGKLFVQYKDGEGNLIPHPRVQGTGREGFFNGTEDFIEQLQALKQPK